MDLPKSLQRTKSSPLAREMWVCSLSGDCFFVGFNTGDVGFNTGETWASPEHRFPNL